MFQSLFIEKTTKDKQGSGAIPRLEPLVEIAMIKFLAYMEHSRGFILIFLILILYGGDFFFTSFA